MLLQIHEPGQTPEPHAEDRQAVGIDLGTTHSVVAYAVDQKVQIIKEEGHQLLPSLFAIDSEGNILVGRETNSLLSSQPKAIIRSIKRLMSYENCPASYKSLFPIEEDSQNPHVLKLRAHNKLLTPTEISSYILKRLKNIAENFLNYSVTQAVITVPAYFNETARTATKQAAFLAGIEPLRLLNEPTAAAIAYGLNTKHKEGTYVVYDLGGGTFDVSILKFSHGVFQVLATAGDMFLGGDDIDKGLLDYILAYWHISVDLLPASFYKFLLQNAQKAKEALSTRKEVNFSFDWQGKNYKIVLTHDILRQITQQLLNKTFSCCQDALEQSVLKRTDIEAVILVGGSCKMPLVKQAVEDYFNIHSLCTIDPELVVAQGAALQAEALVKGSAHLLLDVLPLSLGLETFGGLNEKLIHRNTPIPCSATQEFTTYANNQTALSLHITQGERELVQDCRSLARFSLKGIPPMPAGVARILVMFTVDADGLLSVTAKEKSTGIMQYVEVKPSFGLEAEDIETLIRHSINHGEEDLEQRHYIESRVKLQRLCQETESALEAHAFLLEKEENQALKNLMQSCSVVLQENSSQKSFEEAYQKLKKMSELFAEKIMKHSIKKALKES